jgi:hypothetical protein
MVASLVQMGCGEAQTCPKYGLKVFWIRKIENSSFEISSGLFLSWLLPLDELVVLKIHSDFERGCMLPIHFACTSLHNGWPCDFMTI